MEVLEEVLLPVTNVFVMNKEKWTEYLCSVADQEETAGETVSGNPVEALVECVFENKVLITLKEGAPVHNVVVFTPSGDGNSTKEPGIDPGLTEKPDPAWSLMWRSRTWPRNSSASRAEELEPTKRPTFEGEKGTYKRALHSAS